MITKKDFLRFDLWPRFIDKCSQEAIEMGILKKSVYEGQRNIYGIIGERLVNIVVEGNLERTFEYDIIKNGIKIDVKSTMVNKEPTENFLVDVFAATKEQETDYYAFVFVMKDLSSAWLAGFATKKDFKTHATFRKKGDLIRGNVIAKTNDYCLEAKNLQSFRNIK